MKGEIMDTVKSWDTRNEKEGSFAVQISKSKKLNSNRYTWLKSRLKAKRSDPSIQKKSELSEKVNVTEQNSSDEDETTNADSSFSCAKRKRVDFLLRRVRYSDNAEKSISSDDATQSEENNISESQCNLDESRLEEKLACSVADECKSKTTNFVEYWVPVKLSNVQTEQYCGSLFSNSRVLCSSFKHDPLENLHKILVSTRKCCDHPYLVDWSLCTSLMQGISELEQLDAEIKLSSKLLLLHKILLEIRKRGLRILILCQSLGDSGPITIGDILDDFIHRKFGSHSFVYIGGLMARSKRLQAMKPFNDKGSGKFICLMETRACFPSIKLTSIDTVVLFNSDWDPVNDLRSLLKINLDSQFEQVKVFRLYSAYTVEEKILMLTKQGKTPEGSIIDINRSTSHELLTWGASFLFKKLDKFHDFGAGDTESFLENVFVELAVLLPNSDNSKVPTSNSFIMEVRRIGATNPRNISLLGEVEYPFMDNFSLDEEMIVKEPPHVFWKKLLEGRNPKWKYLSNQSPTTRKVVQRFEDLFEPSVGTSKRVRAEARSTVSQIPADELQCRDKERELPGEVPLQTPHIPSDMIGDRREPNSNCQTSASLNCQPLEASYVSHSKVLLSVRKELQMELERLQKQKADFFKQHQDMKRQTKMACRKEIDQVQKKYEVVLKNAEMAFVKEKEVLETRYNEVLIDKSLAEAMTQTENSKDAALSQVITNCSSDEVYQLILECRRSSMTMSSLKQVVDNLRISSLNGSSVIQQLNQESASEKIAPTANQSRLSPSATLPYQVASSDVAICQPDVRKSCNITDQASLAAISDQHLANSCMAEEQLLPSGRFDFSLPGQQMSGRHEAYPDSRLKKWSPFTSEQQGMIQLSAVQSTNTEAILAPRRSYMTSSMQVPQNTLDLCLSASQLGSMHSRLITFSGNLQTGYQMRAPAPHFRQKMGRPPPFTAHELSCQGPGINFTPVSLQSVTPQYPGCSSSFPAILPP